MSSKLQEFSLSIHYNKMWVHFISPHSLDQWIHCFFTGPYSLQPMNSLKIQWNHLAYMDTFCCNDSKAMDKKTKTFYVHTTMATNISNENNDDFDGVVNEWKQWGKDGIVT